MLEDDNTASETFELYGPKEYSTAEIAELVDREIIKHRRHINIPKRILKPTANLLNKLLWWPITSADEVEREFIDQKIDLKAKTFKDLGIEPADISNLTFHYLVGGPNITQWAGLIRTSSLAARIPKFGFLRFTAGNGTGEAGGKEVLTCYRRSMIV